MLAAWAKLCRSPRKNPPVLLLAGRGGYDNTEEVIARLISEFNLVNRVRLLGSVEDVAGLLAAADLYVHSAVSEGLPNAILEAMAAGLPVVATDLPGIREAVGEEGAPYLVPAADVRALAEQLARFLIDSELCRTLGDALRQRAVTTFSVERMVGQMAVVMASPLFQG